MTNEIILALEILFVFSAILICKKLFGKYGVIGWVAVATILANLLTAKNVELFGLYTSIGTVWFASTFLATDILSECYSEKDAKTAVWFGVFANILFIIGSQITLRYTASPIDYADGYMHGLFATPSSDIYDTGAGFFINAKDFPHKEIKCDDYIVHYGHGSWNKGGYRHTLTHEEFFEKYKTYWNT
jgi:hypothetical protein